MEPESPSPFVENVLSSILLKVDIKTSTALSNTSKPIKGIIAKLLNDDYQWMLMLESILGLSALPEGDGVSYKECYKFVVAIGSNVSLMFTKSVFYAKLGLMMGYDTSVLDLAIKYADIETVELLLEVFDPPAFRWYAFTVNAIDLLRTDVAMLLIKDKQCLDDDPDVIYDIILSAAEHGMSEVFFYLINKYPNINIDDIMQNTYSQVCAIGARNIADYILSKGCGPQEYETDMYFMLDLIEGKDTDLPDLSNSFYSIFTLIEYGHLEIAFKLISKEHSTMRKYYSNIHDSIVLGIRNGRINDIVTLRPLLFRSDEYLIAYVSECIKNYSTKDNELAVGIFQTIRNQKTKLELVDMAYNNGKIELSLRLKESL
jgi:hypothetical protein